MRTLQTVLVQQLSSPSIDGHIHVCSQRGVLPKDTFKGLPPIRIGFADIEYDNISSYSDMTSIYKDAVKLPNTYLLATGLNMKGVKDAYDFLRANGGCYGFGELKLYDEYRGEPIKYKKISFAREVCSFSEKVGDLPVYIHYELNNDSEVMKLENLLEEYPSVPIVLCHCGLNDHNQSYAWNQCVRLCRTYENLWVDVSWYAAQWLCNNPLLLLQLPGDRVFWGSDVSPRWEQCEHKTITIDQIKQYRDILTPYIRSDQNIRRLFNIF